MSTGADNVVSADCSVIPTVNPYTQSGIEPDLGEGACGGDPRCVSPYSDSVDNLSLEVQFEDRSSRHPSEISSLSYQNLLDDGESSGNILSRQQSEDSTDSFPPEYTDNLSQDDIIGTNLNNLPGYISEKYHRTEEDCKISHSEIMTNGDSSSVRDQSTVMSTDSVQKRQHQNEDDESHEKKRNSLEIRNNIPTVGEVKNYENDRENVLYNSQGAKPKIRKQSPGLACRLGEGSTGSGSDREGSVTESEGERVSSRRSPRNVSSEREKTSVEKESYSDSAVKSNDGMEEVSLEAEEEVIQLVKVANIRPTCLIQPHVRESPDLSKVIGSGHLEEIDAEYRNNCIDQRLIPHLKENPPASNLGNEVENEYDYVKYARIQDGDSYVGMRLAYSSTEESKKDNFQLSGYSNNAIDSSRECSPEKLLHHKQDLSSQTLQNVSEDSLTEIPLDVVDSPGIEDKQTFSLSPENTECDSIEVESVSSEKSNMGMPNVEDGLSSSQCSDIEEGPPTLASHKSPTALLHKRQKADLAQELLNLEREYGMLESTPSKPKEMDAEAIMEDLKAKREALDIAIADIKSAIQSSKGVLLKSPGKVENSQEDPIWVKREETCESIRRKEELERVRDELDRLQQEEFKKKEEEKVYQMEEEKSKLLENQFTRNEGKVYQSPKGYDSEEDDDVQYVRNIKGKKYASLPKDDSFDHGAPRVPAINGGNHNRMQSDGSSDSVEYNYSKRNRLHSESESEEYGSDVEAPSKTAYLKQKAGAHLDKVERGYAIAPASYKSYINQTYMDDVSWMLTTLNGTDAESDLYFMLDQQEKRQSKAKEGEKHSSSIHDPDNPSVLIEGVLFRAKYLGSTQLISEGQPSKAMRMMQAQEAVGRIKTLGTLHFGTKFQAPEGENQPSTAVDLFISTEKIMVLNTDLQEIMMDHSLRTVSYIADIGEILVIMARRRIVSSPGEDSLRRKKQAKILCHVFESEEAQLIAQSIGQAFQVAYMEFLKANGIEDPSLMKEIDYQDVLNQQEIYGEELNLFANKDLHKEVIVPKLKGEHIGIVIVESGWGSMVPTVVLANMCPTGPAARCGQLNIGDQIISVNGISLVGLPLSACQSYIKNVKTQTVVKLTVVPCPPVVEVLIKRPDVKYQLGFSVQNGVICSLLRGGIAERGGVRVGHRIIEINNQSVVAVPHEKIVSLLANSVGEIHMKTMPTSIFRLLTGQETPHYL
ncbi:hypothetical protein FSP39_008573 [Pinctada imbricata]|uniref:Uncharacterized protein n=1 Tax=Pinctada imbricata TaxID=66713 RepID=A0AA88Y9T0_PINIB|nr:hypothetical protein FSP39_008573 [Pinctada imbricata]